MENLPLSGSAQQAEQVANELVNSTQEQTALERGGTTPGVTQVTATPIIPAPANEPVPLPLALGLSQRQRVALQALVSGALPGAAARAAGVDPGTVFRWRKYDEHFIAALNTWQTESMKTARQTLATANEEAAAVVLQAVRKGNVKAALAVLAGMGTLTPEKIGPEHPRLAANQRDLALEQVHDQLKFLPRAFRQRLAERRRRDRLAKSQAERDRREAAWVRFAGNHAMVPPLTRPVDDKCVAEAVRDYRHIATLFATRCSFRIMAVRGGTDGLVQMLAEEMTTEAGEVREGLKKLPWLLNLMPEVQFVEKLAARMESLGATVELRPGWVE